MKLKAALLLVTSLAIAGLSASPATSSNYEVSSPPPNGSSPPPTPNGPSPPPKPNGSSPPPPPNGSSPPPPPNGSSPPPPQPPPSKNGILSVEHLYPLKADEGNLLNPRDILLQEIRSFDEDIINEKVQEELGQAIKAEAQKTKTSSASSLPPSNNGSRPPPPPPPAIPTTSTRTSALKELVDAEDLTYVDDPNEDEDDDDEDWDDDDDDNDSFDDEEEILYDQTCPTGCKCGGMYSAATTARCSKLSTEQNFGPSIAHLKIENSDPIQLGPHALREKNLHQLQSLAVVHTSISELDRTAFDGINDLFSINLTGNGLLGIHPDIFQNNTQLSLLTLSENPLQYRQEKSSSDPKYFLDAPSVTELDLTHNALSHLLPTTFTKMPRLVLINLKGNKLRTIDGKIFRSLDQLEELDLSDNQLNGLPADLFADNEYFEILRISGNNLSTLATITATRLESLDASKNRIKIVAKEDLVGLPELEKLDLRSNGLKRIHQHAFVDLFELSYLDISDNRLTSWSEHHLRMNSRLEVLIMNDNPALETLPVFKTEDKSGYGVFRFECANCGLKYLEEGTFDAMPALTRINLAKNSLSSLPKGLFTSLSALRELDLSDNMFAKLEVGMFRGARTLNKLNLAGNNFVTLQVAPFLLTPSLARLDVSRCALERVWSEARMPFTSLRFLSVRDNRLMRITVEELRATPKLSGLDISDNPLACEEEFSDAIEWLLQKGITPTETHKYISNYAIGGDDSEAEGVSQWSDLEAQVCDREDGPPLRPEPRRPNDILPRIDDLEDMDPISRKEFDDEQIDHGQDHDDPEDGWPIEDYDIYASTSHPWYSGALWPVITVVLVTLAVVLLVANFAVCIARRRGRGPVIRTPMILRPGLIDNKNCGMVYKPLQEEIATPHMPKRGSFYSSSTFHYDKIVPESV